VVDAVDGHELDAVNVVDGVDVVTRSRWSTAMSSTRATRSTW